MAITCRFHSPLKKLIIASTNIAPFILRNGTWTEIRPFTVDELACTVTFIVPSDPVIAVFYNTRSALQSSMQTTSIMQQEQPSQSSNGLAFMIIVVIAIILAIIFVYKKSAVGKSRSR